MKEKRKRREELFIEQKVGGGTCRFVNTAGARVPLPKAPFRMGIGERGARAIDINLMSALIQSGRGSADTHLALTLGLIGFQR